jgi:hypothetical protein
MTQVKGFASTRKCMARVKGASRGVRSRDGELNKRKVGWERHQIYITSWGRQGMSCHAINGCIAYPQLGPLGGGEIHNRDEGRGQTHGTEAC